VGLTAIGLEVIASVLSADGLEDVFNHDNTFIGVGSSITAFDPAQTDLLGTSKFRQGMDEGYPQRTDNAITFKATFAAEDANFSWNEYGLFNAETGGDMLMREAGAISLKTSPKTSMKEIVFTTTLTLTLEE
jgi:hypothetical protein